MQNGVWTIRSATIQDARAIAGVHIESYKAAYRGIFPDPLLNGLSAQKYNSSWHDLLSRHEPSSPITLAGCDTSGSLVGFASGGNERTGQLGCDGELYAIYLRPDAQRKGLGGLLVREFAQALAARGCSSMAVWVLELNPSRRFYESLGGQVIGRQQIERGGQMFFEVAYGWQDLNTFS